MPETLGECKVNTLKNLFIVKQSDGSTRLSKAMIGNVVVLIASIALLVGVELSENDIAVITAAAMSVGGIILRLESSGGTIKIKGDRELQETDDDDYFEGV